MPIPKNMIRTILVAVVDIILIAIAIVVIVGIASPINLDACKKSGGVPIASSGYSIICIDKNSDKEE